MADSMSEYLGRDMECEGLLECVHGLNDLDRQAFEALTASREALTVDEVAERVDRERSTAYRSIQRLRGADLVEKEQVNYESGGYYHVYRPADPDDVADRMERVLDDWYAEIGGLIEEFREKYDGRAARSAAAEN